ncbi:MAG: HDOD domain-containing protein [Phycisphaerae bacterium]|nr:HDOD domain-containing protein [Phycisphaerae bacterium]
MKARKDLSSREVDNLHQNLMRRLGDSSVPTLPEVAVKVIQLVGNPNATLKQFVDVVQNDQALTGRLLRSANSAAFAQRQPVTQLQRAMILLGLDRLKAMALGFHLSQAAAKDEGDFSFKKLWTHSIFRAWAAFRLTEYFDRTITGEAFIVGLMLDAGIPMMPKLAGPNYSKAVNHADLPARQYQAELNTFEFTHLDVIAALARMWKLPPLLTKPMLNHHSSPDAMDPKDPESVLRAVAYFVGTLQLEPDDQHAPTGAAIAAAKRLFNLSPEEVKKAFKNAASDFRSTKEMFSHILDESISVEQILSHANLEMTESTAATSSTPPAPTARFESSGLVLEVEAAGSHKVKVYVADASGNRLLSEEIEPRNRTPDEIRKILMLDTAPKELIDRVCNEMKRMAA